jgi:hypothetical protein
LVWIGIKLFPNDGRLIRKRLAAIAEHASIRPNESSLARVANASKLIEFFAQDVTVQVEGLELAVHDRNDLREAVLAARANLREVEVQFVDIHVSFPEGKDAAIAYLSAIAHLDGQTNAFGQELKVSLRKVNRDWLVSGVESVSVGASTQ